MARDRTDVIEDRSLVGLAYTLTDDSGVLLEATEEGRPFTYIHGTDQLLPGLGQTLHGMRAGEETDVTLRPEEAYGRVDPAALMEVPKDELPEEALVPGTELRVRKPGREAMFVTVKEVRARTVVLDLNHPFAGKTVRVHLRVVQVVPEPETG